MRKIIEELEQAKRAQKAEIDRINANYVKGSYEHQKAIIQAVEAHKQLKQSKRSEFERKLIRAQAQADTLKECYEALSKPTKEQLDKGDRVINLLATAGNKLSSDMLNELLVDVHDLQQLRIINDILSDDKDFHKAIAVKRRAEEIEALTTEQDNYTEILNQLETNFNTYVDSDGDMDFMLFSLADMGSKIEEYHNNVESYLTEQSTPAEGGE